MSGSQPGRSAFKTLAERRTKELQENAEDGEAVAPLHDSGSADRLGLGPSTHDIGLRRRMNK